MIILTIVPNRNWRGNRFEIDGFRGNFLFGQTFFKIIKKKIIY